jgi:hypothetical protein
MKEKFEKIVTWLKDNKLVAAIGGFVLLFLLYKKFAKKTYRRRRSSKSFVPRSRGRRTKKSGSYNRVIKSGANRGKKAWQIKGSPEAKRRMATLRRMRSRKLL